MDDLREQWEFFLKDPFPAALAGEEVAGVCLTSVDSCGAGCISSLLEDGSLDTARVSVLEECQRDLSIALPEIPPEGRAYFERLSSIVDAALRRLGRAA